MTVNAICGRRPGYRCNWPGGEIEHQAFGHGGERNPHPTLGRAVGICPECRNFAYAAPEPERLVPATTWVCPICQREEDEDGRDNMGNHIWSDHVEGSDYGDGIIDEWAECDFATFPCLQSQEQLNEYFRINKPLGDSMPPTTVIPDPIAILVGPNLAALVRLAPNQPDLRGLILQKARIWVPEDIPDIAAWLEAYQPPAPPVVEPPPQPVARPAATAQRRYEFEGSFSEVIRGTCTYSETEHRAGSVAIREDDLIRAAEQSHDEDNFRERVEELIRENNNFLVQEYADLSHDNYQSDDGDGPYDWEHENIDSVMGQFFADHPELHPDRRNEEPEPAPNPGLAELFNATLRQQAQQPLPPLAAALVEEGTITMAPAVEPLRWTMAVDTAATPVTVPEPEPEEDDEDEDEDEDERCGDCGSMLEDCDCDERPEYTTDPRPF